MLRLAHVCKSLHIWLCTSAHIPANVGANLCTSAHVRGSAHLVARVTGGARAPAVEGNRERPPHSHPCGTPEGLPRRGSAPCTTSANSKPRSGGDSSSLQPSPDGWRLETWRCAAPLLLYGLTAWPCSMAWPSVVCCVVQNAPRQG